MMRLNQNLRALQFPCLNIPSSSSPIPIATFSTISFLQIPTFQSFPSFSDAYPLCKTPRRKRTISFSATSSVPNKSPLDLTEDNVRLVLADARVELAQIFDASVGMTGVVELAEMDGPFVKISLKGRFWHMRSMVVARVGNYLKQRIPEILEVEIEDEKQLDDSPANF